MGCDEKCQSAEIINIVREDLKEIKHDIKGLLKFKNQLMGVVIATSSIFTIVGQTLIFVFKH